LSKILWGGGGRSPLEDLGEAGRVTLKLTLKKQGMKVWTVFNWFRIRYSGADGGGGEALVNRITIFSVP
jgi:hypothetical protein